MRRPGLIAGVQALGDDPLEPLLARRRQQARALAAVRRGNAPRRALQRQLLQSLRGARYRAARSTNDRRGRAGRRSRTRRVCSAASRRTAEGEVTCIRRCSRSKLGRPCSSKATISPSSTASRIPSCAQQLRGPRDSIGDLVQVAALEPQPAGLQVRDRANPVPLDLERPVSLAEREAAPERASIGTIRSGIGSRVGIRGRIHAMDHPVARRGLVAGDREQAVAPAQPLAPEA